MAVLVAPSLLAANALRLEDDAKRALGAGADWLHLDVMDGHFVPNLTMGLPFVKPLRTLGAPVDVHLMITNPDTMGPEYARAGATNVTIHAEAATHLHRALSAIKEAGATAGVALNPGTPLQAVTHVLELVDVLLVMTVNPGYGGQKFIRAMIPKIEAARKMLDEHRSRAHLEVDGGIDPETAPLAIRAGADVLVAGTSVFGADEPLKARIARLKGSR